MELNLNDVSTDRTEKEAVVRERKLRVGLIGTGGIAKGHMKNYLLNPSVEVVAGVDLIPGKAQKFFEEFESDAKAFEDYKEMVDTMNLDAVSVCTYNRTHKECTVYALEHGLHVLLEKPMSVTLEEAVEICRAEKKSGKIVSVGFQPRYDPNMQMIKRIVDSGELGQVYYVQTGGGRRHGIPVGWSTTFIEEDKAGVGALGDIGCYSLDLVLNALGYPKPLTVTGKMTDHFGKNPASYTKAGKPECAKIFSVDDFASAYIRLEGDIILDFRIAWYMHLDTPGDTIIMGTKASLRVPSTTTWNGSFDKPMTIYRDIAGEPSEMQVPLFPPETQLFSKKINSFVDAILNGTEAPIPTSQILYNQAIIDGIMRSSELGCEVKIEIPEI